MKRLLALLGAAMILAGCASPGGNANYKGPDAGALVLSIAYTQPSDDYYVIYYRRLGDLRQDGDYVSIHTSGDIFRTIDFTDPDSGSVVTEHLAPGTYEFYMVAADSQGGERFYSKNAFSLRFDIKPGQTTYVCSYTAMLVTQKRHDWLLGQDYDGAGGVYFVVSDKHERDVEIARRREPNLLPVTVSVPQDHALPPYFRTRQLDL
jgi:hypothetical protein